MEFTVAEPFFFSHRPGAHAAFDAGFRAGRLRDYSSLLRNSDDNPDYDFAHMYNSVPDVDDMYKYIVSDFKASYSLVRHQMQELAAFYKGDGDEGDDYPTLFPRYYTIGRVYGEFYDSVDITPDYVNRAAEFTLKRPPGIEVLTREIAVMLVRKGGLSDHHLEYAMSFIPMIKRTTVIARLLLDPAFVPRMAMFRAADVMDVRLLELFTSAMASGRLAVTWDGFPRYDGVVTVAGLMLASVARHVGLEATPAQLASLLPEDLTDDLVDSLMVVLPWRDALAAYRWHPVFTAKVLPRWLEAGMTPDLTGIDAIFVDPYTVLSNARRAFAMSVDAAVGVLPDLLLNGAPAKAVYEATKRDPRAREVVRRFLLLRTRALKAVGLPVELAAKVLRLKGHRWAGSL